ncbi:hypothetical protein R5R35_004759 [Gryllus longicercus]|uniref:Uncharacterized protein n=1 Tax=Gryllus longicercus TaxID=2509291 RepID=A0AAN9ZEQ0_9ORTH
MRHQHVGVDVVKMIVSSCSYLALAFAAWVLLRLVQACFYLPGILRRRNEEEAQQLLRAQQLPSSSGEASTSKDGDEVKDSDEAKDSDKGKDSDKRKGSDKRKNGDQRKGNSKQKVPEAEKLLQAEKSDEDCKESDVADSPDEDTTAAQFPTSAADGDDKETKKDI